MDDDPSPGSSQRPKAVPKKRGSISKSSTPNSSPPEEASYSEIVVDHPLQNSSKMGSSNSTPSSRSSGKKSESSSRPVLTSDKRSASSSNSQSKSSKRGSTKSSGASYTGPHRPIVFAAPPMQISIPHYGMLQTTRRPGSSGTSSRTELSRPSSSKSSTGESNRSLIISRDGSRVSGNLPAIFKFNYYGSWKKDKTGSGSQTNSNSTKPPTGRSSRKTLSRSESVTKLSKPVKEVSGKSPFTVNTEGPSSKQIKSDFVKPKSTVKLQAVESLPQGNSLTILIPVIEQSDTSQTTERSQDSAGNTEETKVSSAKTSPSSVKEMETTKALSSIWPRIDSDGRPISSGYTSKTTESAASNRLSTVLENSHSNSASSMKSNEDSRGKMIQTEMVPLSDIFSFKKRSSISNPSKSSETDSESGSLLLLDRVDIGIGIMEPVSPSETISAPLSTTNQNLSSQDDKKTTFITMQSGDSNIGVQSNSTYLTQTKGILKTSDNRSGSETSTNPSIAYMIVHQEAQTFQVPIFYTQESFTLQSPEETSSEFSEQTRTLTTSEERDKWSQTQTRDSGSSKKTLSSHTITLSKGNTLHKTMTSTGDSSKSNTTTSSKTEATNTTRTTDRSTSTGRTETPSYKTNYPTEGPQTNTSNPQRWSSVGFFPNVSETTSSSSYTGLPLLKQINIGLGFMDLAQQHYTGRAVETEKYVRRAIGKHSLVISDSPSFQILKPPYTSVRFNQEGMMSEEKIPPSEEIPPPGQIRVGSPFPGIPIYDRNAEYDKKGKHVDVHQQYTPAEDVNRSSTVSVSIDGVLQGESTVDVRKRKDAGQTGGNMRTSQNRKKDRRKSKEDGRKSEEDGRKSKEDWRKSEEDGRKLKDDGRKSEEDERKSKEGSKSEEDDRNGHNDKNQGRNSGGSNRQSLKNEGAQTEARNSQNRNNEGVHPEYDYYEGTQPEDGENVVFEPHGKDTPISKQFEDKGVNVHIRNDGYDNNDGNTYRGSSFVSGYGSRKGSGNGSRKDSGNGSRKDSGNGSGYNNGDVYDNCEDYDNGNVYDNGDSNGYCYGNGDDDYNNRNNGINNCCGCPCIPIPIPYPMPLPQQCPCPCPPPPCPPPPCSCCCRSKKKPKKKKKGKQWDMMSMYGMFTVYQQMFSSWQNQMNEQYERSRPKDPCQYAMVLGNSCQMMGMGMSCCNPCQPPLIMPGNCQTPLRNTGYEPNPIFEVTGVEVRDTGTGDNSKPQTNDSRNSK